jgi:hypothetical protein
MLYAIIVYITLKNLNILCFIIYKISLDKMSFDVYDLSSIENEQSEHDLDDGSMSDDGSMDDDGSVGDLSDADTASVVSNDSVYDECISIYGPEWHFTQPLSQFENDEAIDDFLRGQLVVQPKSKKQWFRFFLRGHRMKSVDPLLLDIAYNLKWGMWCLADQDYQVYSGCIMQLVHRMEVNGLLSMPYID